MGDRSSGIEQQRRRSHWAWGYEDETPGGAELRSTAAAMAAVLGFGDPGELEEPVPLHQVRLPAARLRPPPELAGICSQSVHDRAWHAHGQSYRDLISAFRGRFDHVPDLVARPHREDEVTALLSWCEDVGAAVIPFGGGTSVSGGVEPDVGSGYAASVSVDLSRMARVLEVDDVSGAALVEAGTPGPSLNAQLARHGRTLRRALLVLGFESADHPVAAWLERALQIAGGHGGQWDGTRSTDAGRPGRPGDGSRAAPGWRQTFRAMPYLRNAYPAMGVLAETFESAVTWDAFPAFHENVLGAAEQAVRRECGRGIVMCRLAFAYPDGAAPYYTLLAPARRGEEVAQWDAVKKAASDAVLAAGGTITHHHAVGRDHRSWYERQRPEPFGRALRGAKTAVDPHGILNPGVLLPPSAGGTEPGGRAWPTPA
jgi:FAD/FMN-containing dehydrogenase